MITTEGLLEAYYECRARKRKTSCAIMYELDYESRLIGLRDRINRRAYSPGKSICFVITRPRHREVFAAAFEDRIVHHWIAIRLEPLFEKMFSPRTFNCRKGKGQLYGVSMLQADIYECSKGYSSDCYVMKLDIQGFFMSIDKSMLAGMLDRFILENYENEEDIEELRYLCRTVIMHCPEKLCERHSPESFWSYLPANKSLFTNGDGLGVAIGNLFAQHFANFLLNVLDQFLIDNLFKYVGRYVDDFYIVDSDKRKMLSAIPQIRTLLRFYGLTLHPRKFYLQHYSKGVAFTGSIVKRDRVYICNRTVSNFIALVLRLNKARNIRDLTSAVSSINSYLGFLRHGNEYAMRCKALKMIKRELFKYLYIKGHYDSIAIKRKYTARYKTIQRIKAGERGRRRSGRTACNSRTGRGADRGVVEALVDSGFRN